MHDDMRARRIRLARALFLTCGAWLVGLGVYFIFSRPPLLPEDPRFIGATWRRSSRACRALPDGFGWCSR